MAKKNIKNFINNNNNENDIYTQTQINKKHRTKSQKLQHRILKKRSKKQQKQINFQNRSLSKFLLHLFKSRKKKIDLIHLPFDFNQIKINVKKIISHKDNQSIERLLMLINKMEKTFKEINLNSFENKSIIKDVMSLFKNLKIKQNPKNNLKFSLYHMIKKNNEKKRYTTDTDEIIRECLDSYYLLVKGLFDFFMKQDDSDNNNNDDDNNNENNSNDENNSNINNNDDDNNNNDEDDNSFDKKKFAIDEEYNLIENKLGRNAELINKAYNKIINEDNNNNNNTNKDNNNKNEDEELKETNINNIEEVNETNEKNINKPKPSEFLKITMNLLNNQ